MNTTPYEYSVVHIVESFGAGTLQIVRELANHQESNGWNVTIFHGNRPETPANYYSLFNNKIKLFPLITGRSINGFLDIIDVFRVAKYIRQKNIDIVHAHSSKGGGIGRAATLLSGAKTIYSPHGFSFMNLNGPNKKSITFKIEKLLSRIPSEIVCCSNSELEAAKLLNAKSSCIENFIDYKELPASYTQKPIAKDIDVITVGRVSDQKNPELFIQIARAMPHLNFWWVGGPREACKSEWPSNVKVTGWLPRSETLYLYSRSKIYLSTSNYEGMPIVMLEAMAAGLPIVSTNVPGSRDIISAGKNGDLFNDIAEAVSIISNYLSNHTLYKELSETSISILEERFSKHVILKKWMEKYKSIISTTPYSTSEYTNGLS